LKRGLVVMTLLLALSPAPPPSLAQDAEGFVVVVNAANETTEIPQDLVARMFLRKVRTWHKGTAVAPVDLSLATPLRAAFSRKVLGLSGSEVRDYWMKQTLSGGEVPPALRASESEVLEFVKSERGSIGYVSAGAKLPPEVKVVKVTQ
jgi:ABC-type phosphate transport system substrate-binding protein